MGYSWVWAHSNKMLDDSGKDDSFIFEALTSRPRVLSRFPGPKISSFFFHYRGKDYFFNRLWDSIRAQSTHTLEQWKFKIDRGDLSFRGEITANLKEFSGLTYEDTNGSVVHCSSSNVSRAKIQIFRAGKLEASYHSQGFVTYEVASRTRDKYVLTHT
jgi:hypothetical protein